MSVKIGSIERKGEREIKHGSRYFPGWRKRRTNNKTANRKAKINVPKQMIKNKKNNI